MPEAELRPEELRALCDMDQGVLSPRIYTDEAIHRLELDRIFGRAWVLLCPDQQIPNPGDARRHSAGARSAAEVYRDWS